MPPSPLCDWRRPVTRRRRCTIAAGAPWAAAAVSSCRSASDENAVLVAREAMSGRRVQVRRWRR
eukprot:8601-Prymnesium_polylepis.3